MADVALAQGPWALLNSADAMRHMIADVATAYRTTSPERSSACLSASTTTVRKKHSAGRRRTPMRC